MNREERERMVDRLLDQALAARQVEPRPGLEERVLAGLRPQPEPRLRWRWLWIPAAVAAAVLLIVIATQWTRSPQPQRPPVAVKEPSAPAPEKKVPEPAQVAAQPAKKKPPGSARRQTVQVAKVAPPSVQAASPTPVPGPYPKPSPFGGAEFRALIAMLRGNPDEARLIATRQQESRKEAEEFLNQADKQ